MVPKELKIADNIIMACTNESSQEDAENKSDTKDETLIECAVCLQTSIYPVQLPCSHVFCFLCVKGFTTQSKRCAMCRREVPEDYLQNPELLTVGKKDLQAVTEKGFNDEDGECWQWMYEGRNGWWLYDERTSQEVEKCFKRGQQRCELLIAGFLYIIDFEHMLQYRRNDPSRRRRIKRDLASAPKKGVAGLRMESEQTESQTVPSDNTHNDNNEDNSDTNDNEDDQDIASALNNLSINNQNSDES